MVFFVLLSSGSLHRLFPHSQIVYYTEMQLRKIKIFFLPKIANQSIQISTKNKYEIKESLSIFLKKDQVVEVRQSN